jgi:uncharacterized membrane protein
MFCSKCGAENPEGAKFCSKCGAPLEVSIEPSEAAAKSGERSSTGLSANLAGLLCYVGGWISGIVFVVLEKNSKFVKFHAWQSIMTFGVLTVIQIILSIIAAIAWATFAPGAAIAAHIVGVIVWVITGILWIVLMILAYQGKMWKVPGAGDWAEKRASKSS